ncbi:MAG: hypothetical protein JNJ46_10000 [Myxococcales bacterium]|nr:hypothetical protein [Myxococcales bacterium]
MPRCSVCVLCGDPIEGRGRIDRIYCSASCRTLAWRARSGDRWAGRRKSLPPQPGSYVARRALPLLAVRMRAELDAAKRRIAELEKKLGERAGGVGHGAAKIAGGAVAAVAGAVAIAAAVEQERNRVQQAERERARAQVEAEQQRHQAELTAERERAAQREAELRQQVTALTTRVEEASARERAAAAQVARLRQDENALHQRLDDESNRIWKMHFELASLRTAVSDARAQANRNYEAILAESALRQHVEMRLAEASEQRREIASQLASVRKQLAGERRDWKKARAQLMQQAGQGTQRQLGGYRELQRQLEIVQVRAETADATVRTLRSEAKEQQRLYLETIEQLQSRQLPPGDDERKRLSGKKHDKRLPGKKKRKQLSEGKKSKQLPARSGIIEKVAMTVTSAVVGAVAGIGLGKRLGDGDGKLLPSKKETIALEVIPVERKLLPPKRD